MKNVSLELKNLIKRMLVPAKERISIAEIYEHPWMNVTEVSKQNLRLNYGRIINFSKFSKVTPLIISAENVRSQLHRFSDVREGHRETRKLIQANRFEP